MNDRAVSEILGFTLIFALILSAVALVSVIGFADLDDTRQFEQSNNAERAFDVLADNMDDVLLRGAPSRATEIKLTNAQLYTGDQVTINISANDSTRGLANLNNSVYTYQPIVYEGEGNTQIIYSNGAVFRDQRDGGRVVRDPPFVIEQDRLHMPIAKTQTRTGSAQSIGGTTIRLRAIEADAARSLDVLARDTPYRNVTINVTSPRYELWENYLSEQPGVRSCATDETTESVVCRVAYNGAGTPERISINRVSINVQFER